MNGFKKAAWIWIDSQNEVDCYGEFYTSFYWNGNDTACRISCDGDYSLFINESYVASWQYSDYEHYKIYDTVDITPYLQKGTNHFAVLLPSSVNFSIQTSCPGFLKRVHRMKWTDYWPLM